MKTIPQIVVPVFLAVGNLAPIFSSTAFLKNNQTLKIDEGLLLKNGTYLLYSPFTVFKRKSAAMFLCYSSSNSRHVGKLCGVMVRVHELTFLTAESLRTLESSRFFPLSWHYGGIFWVSVVVCGSRLYSCWKIPV